jgi:hypothetical protein
VRRVQAPEYWLPIGDGWHLWSDLEQRGAGFPAEWLLELADPESARRAGDWLTAEAEEHAARALVVAGIEREVALASSHEQLSALRAALSRARRGLDADPGTYLEALAPLTGPWRESRARLADRWAELQEAHGSGGLRTAAALRVIAGDSRFREALVWQNRPALERVNSLLASPAPARNSATRQKERLMASYVQRYCAKNDRIGFFGPHSWGWLVKAGPPLTVRPGASLLARRITRLEAWAVDALADRLAEDPELRILLAPRLMPSVRLEGQVLHHSVDRRTELPIPYARLLAVCDGHASARLIAGALVADEPLELSDPDEVYEMLGELAEKRVVVWTVDVPTSGGRPEELLRAALEQVEPGPARERALAALAELERAREHVACAAGSPELTEAALRQLDEVFVRLSGTEPSRSPGKAYAGRTLAFEMCARDVEIEIGPALWQELAAPLALLLLSARWFTHEIAVRYRVALAALHDRLRAAGGGAPVEYQRFASHLPELFPGGEQPGSIVDGVRQELRTRWREVIRFGGDDKVVQRSAKSLGDPVRAAFAAPGPGWPAARHQSIDLLIAASSAEAVPRGELVPVVGEVHPGLNTLLIPDLPHPYGDVDVLFERRDREIGRPCVAPVWSRARTHLDYYSRSPADYEVEQTAARAWRPRDHVLAAADLVMEAAEGGLEVRTRDGRISFDVIAFLEQHLIAESHQQFSIAGGDAHTPRIVIDGLVVSRERWSMAPSEVEFAAVEDPALRFARARGWALRRGLPRFVFLRTPEEVKPTYVDLESPIYVDLAAKAIRGAAAVSLSEMLPSVDECWLLDSQGLRYTTELRLAAVDPIAWAPSGPAR